MKKALLLFVCLLFTVPAFAADRFLEGYEQSVAGDPIDRVELGRVAQDHAFALVTGYGGDSIGRVLNYYQFVRGELKELGVPGNHIRTFRPASFRSVESNAPRLMANLKAYREKTGKPLVLVGHSMGAVISLLAAFEDPQWVQENIPKIYLVQGPIRGSNVSNYVTGVSDPAFQKVGLVTRILGVKIWTLFLDEVLQMRASQASMTTEVSEARLRKLETDHPEWVEKFLAEKFVFVASERSPKDSVTWMSDGARKFLVQAYPGEPNDSMVLTRNESWDHEGARVVVLKGWQHMEFLGRVYTCPQMWWTATDRASRNSAFVHGILSDLR